MGNADSKKGKEPGPDRSKSGEALVSEIVDASAGSGENPPPSDSTNLKPKNIEIKSTESERIAIGMISSCLRRLPINPSLCSDEDVLKKLYSTSKTLNIKAGRDILLKNKQCKGIFVIRKGHIQVLSQCGEVRIANLGPNDFFGEVSTLYGITCTARVRASKDCLLLLIKKDVITKIINQDVSMDILDWFVQQRYMPTGGGFDNHKMERRLALGSFSSISVFDKWHVDAKKNLVLAVGSDTSILYPEKSVLMDEGDPPIALYVVIRGRVAVLRGGKQIAEIEADACPVSFNEEGIRLQKESCYRLQTVTCCQVLTVRISTITNTMKTEHKSKANEPWQTRQNLWKRRKSILDSELYKDFPAHLQLEVLASALEKIPLFSDNFFPALYDMALMAKVDRVHPNKGIIYSLDPGTAQLFVILQGTINVKPDRGKPYKLQPTDQKPILYDPLTLEQRETLATETDCIILKLPRSQVLGLVGKDVNNSNWLASTTW